MTWTALDQRRRSNGAAPLVTYLGPEGRMDLSAATIANAAAKIGNALRDEFELDEGQRVGLFLPQHWQRATWLAGIWTAGCIVCPESLDVDLVIGSIDRVPHNSGKPTGVVSMHPFGLPTGDPLPPGVHDASLVAQQQPDAYLFSTPADAVVLDADGERLSASQAMRRASDRAAAWRMDAGGRLLLTAGLTDVDSWLSLLPVPLAMNGSVVIAADDRAADESPDGHWHLDAATIERERITSTTTR